MWVPEAVRHLIATLTVALAVVVQHYGTSGGSADQVSRSNTFGVELLVSELNVAKSWEDLAMNAAPSLELEAHLPGLDFAPTPRSVRLGERTQEAPWRAARPMRFEREDGGLGWPENRDSAGTLIRLTSNDVLSPVSISF